MNSGIVFDRQLGIHDQHLRIDTDHADRLEVLDRVVGRLAHRRKDRDRAGAGPEQSVAVGRRMRHRLGRDACRWRRRGSRRRIAGRTLRSCAAQVRRATLSMLPPAAKPTRTLTGFCGQSCACAAPAGSPASAPNDHAGRRAREMAQRDVTMSHRGAPCGHDGCAPSTRASRQRVKREIVAGEVAR